MIQNLKLYVLLNSFGSHSIKVKLWTRTGCYQAMVPLDDSRPENVEKVKAMFTSIRPNFMGLNEEDWLSTDRFMNQLKPNRQPINPAITLAISIASARAATQNELWRIGGKNNVFPHIMGVVVKGKDWREFLLIPHKERTITDAYHLLTEAWKITGEELKDKGVLRGRSLNGAWLSELGDVETLYLLDQIARDWNMKLGINVGGSSLWDGSRYVYAKSKGLIVKKDLSAGEQMSLISAIMEQYKIWYIEDPFRGGDFMSHAYLSQRMQESVVAGGDLYNADISRIKRAFKTRATKAITINSTQLPSISHMAEIKNFAKDKELMLVLSRSHKETEDTWLADLGVAFGTDMLKLGLGSDNVPKFNRLLEMWDDIPSPMMRTEPVQEKDYLVTSPSQPK